MIRGGVLFYSASGVNGFVSLILLPEFLLLVMKYGTDRTQNDLWTRTKFAEMAITKVSGLLLLFFIL